MTRSNTADAEKAQALRQALSGLVVESGGGDRAAFRKLYDLSSRFVFGIVLAIVRDRQMAEEVSQEVYVSIWRRAGTFDPGSGNATAWLAAIARNRAIDRLRAERARGAVSFTDTPPDFADERANSELTADGAALRRRIDTLRPEYRKALLLTYFYGYSHQELATVLEVPLGTAKSWLRRGLEELREAVS